MRAPLPPASDPKIEYVGNKGSDIPGMALIIKAVELSIENAAHLAKGNCHAMQNTIKFEVPLKEGPGSYLPNSF